MADSLPSQAIQVVSNPIVKRQANFIQLSELAKCNGKRVVLDTETTGLFWHKNVIIGLGIHCPDAGVSGYVPALDIFARRDIYSAVKEISPGTTIIAHNAKFDLHFLNANAATQGWNLIDTTALVHIVDSRKKKAMSDAERVFLSSESKRMHVDAAPHGLTKKVWEWPVGLTAAYCENDCVVTYQLAQKLVPMVAELGLWELMQKDMAYLSVLWDAERRGMVIDRDFVTSSIVKLQDHLHNLEQELYDSVGYEFNWRSPQQLSKAIYQNLGIPKPKNPFADADGIDRSRFADAGKYKSTCTSSFILTEKIHHPLGTLIFAIREDDKLLRNYLTKWLDMVDDENAVHCNFNITGTRTGRLSSSKPNLQNVPAEARGRFTQSVYTGSVERADEYNLRRAFVSRPGMTYLSIDYKQMEMRMFGILSKDPFMLNSLIAGKDVHLEIAHKVWGHCGETTDKVHREWSKTISFGLIYGMTIGSLQYKLNMTRKEAIVVCDQYWKQFPRIKPWLNDVVDECKKWGYVRYWSGRIWREDNQIDMYKGANALIQGGCADLLSIAAIRTAKWLKNRSSQHGIVSLVHDELIMEVPDEDVAETSNAVSEIMRVPDLFGIPFATDAKWGKSYGTLEKQKALQSPVPASEQIIDLIAADAPVLDPEIASQLAEEDKEYDEEPK